MFATSVERAIRIRRVKITKLVAKKFGHSTYMRSVHQISCEILLSETVIVDYKDKIMINTIVQSGRRFGIAGKRLLSTEGTTRYAIACPGQGIVKDGLLAPYAKFHSHFKESLEIIDETLKEKLSEKLLNDTPGTGKEWLIHTSNAQPAILATTYIICEILNKEYGINLPQNDKVEYLLGHSLGEYTAHLLGGTLDLAGAISLVRERGRLMEELITSEEYCMVALMFKPSFFNDILETSQREKVLANINSYQQIVLSGKSSKIDEVVKLINSESKKILRAVKLPIRIPFHNSILQEIELLLFDFGSPLKDPSKPIVSNLTGAVSDNAYASTIKANSQPVQWIKSIEYLLQNGITDVINLGPGDVLQGLNSKFKIRNHSIDGIEAMSKLQNLL